MPQSFADVYLHIVFATLNRQPFLTDAQLRKDTHAYIGGIAKQLGCQPLGVGGVDDHVHVLAKLSRQTAISDLIRDLKSNSSRWIRPKFADFQWQSGYAAHSFGKSDLPDLQHYVNTQEEHHRTVSFVDEYRGLLDEHGFEYDEKYLWS